jgi:hypothetical protein
MNPEFPSGDARSQSEEAHPSEVVPAFKSGKRKQGRTGKAPCSNLKLPRHISGRSLCGICGAQASTSNHSSKFPESLR